MWILILLILVLVLLHHKRFEFLLILLEDEPATDIKPHAEDPGTPELIALQLPKHAVDRKSILRQHRERKLSQQNMLDQQRVVPQAAAKPKPKGKASPKPKAKSSPKPKAKSSSSSSRVGMVKTTALKKSKEIGSSEDLFF